MRTVKLRVKRFGIDDDIVVELAENERIVSVETSPAASSYVWIADDRYDTFELARLAVENADRQFCRYGEYD